MTLGYDNKLFILAFDHRGSFQKKMFGIAGEPSAAETAKIVDAKSVIFDGFTRALSQGAPADAAGILVDEQFGADVARKARANGWIAAMPVEKSGLDYFDFEYGDEFGKHIEEFDPSFAKILLRYNPDGDAELNRRSVDGLKRLSDWLHDHDRKFLLELLVPAEPAQLEAVAGSDERYDLELRPRLMRTTMEQLQNAGIEPDIWKIEGIDRREDCETIAAQAKAGGRHGVGCVVLGRGADTEKVEHWLRQGAGVDGYLGFAIGRTIWWDQLEGYLDGSLSRDDAAAQIAEKYRRAIDVYNGAA
ncbi:MAG: 2-deoxy-5-keto-D-gluconate 6-phosphate aldolase domain-containing protein [Acidimicrobiia bacterium]